MITKFNIGDSVYVKGKVVSINVTEENQIVYSVLVNERTRPMKFTEDKLMGDKEKDG